MPTLASGSGYTLSISTGNDRHDSRTLVDNTDTSTLGWHEAPDLGHDSDKCGMLSATVDEEMLATHLLAVRGLAGAIRARDHQLSVSVARV